ncbi:hypothetical protein GUITHDRAFT_141718 [Guillardia theta CCMP2712]|uniref:Calpain catalytic domain-containing protein n=1 Tax=Guillardia theta (strain CCMP2712) TaxID=905079 RepID=L1J0U9_GUITC|nr:hypothetical protein GUITHDRAFT_141718 [Guillardia theta CCMP2712]EKX41715.1 hypothetical protein GUITHDRAFT_141718 [Guillardia theta CCMP2712]|eukprot:XP_005828695.1 hypothetical protein GUITHDRAFT_141718 [Guillardia theta CCMP2712]
MAGMEDEELEEYLAMKDRQAMARAGRSSSSSHGRPAVSFAPEPAASSNAASRAPRSQAGDGVRQWSGAGGVQEAVRQKASKLEQLHAQQGSRLPQSTTRGNPVPRKLTRSWGKQQPGEVEVATESKGPGEIKRLPQAKAFTGSSDPSALKGKEQQHMTMKGEKSAKREMLIPFTSGSREEELLADPANRDEGGKFVDPDFPAAASSLFMDPRKPSRHHIPHDAVKWIRPHQIVSSGGAVVFGEAAPLVEGSLGNGWFVGALGCLVGRRDLLEVLIPSTENGRAYGIYTVRYYKYGQWHNVVIDDRIPCDQVNVPLYTRSSDPQQIWPMLLEKAYAKMHGCYEALVTGSVTYALRDLTGGAAQAINLREENVQDQIMNGYLWQQLLLWCKQGLLGCWQEVEREGRTTDFDGDFKSHCVYSILDVKEPAVGMRFMKLKPNVQTNSSPWSGMWSNDGPEWVANPEIAKALDYDKASMGGSFWMTFEDWTRYFHVLHICQLFPPSWYVPRSTHPQPEPLVVQGAWRKTARLCGGLPKMGNPNWWQNPQVMLKLATGEKTQVFISVTQQDSRFNPDYERGASTPSFRKPFKEPAEYNVAIGVAVVRKRVLEGKKLGSQLKRADVELMSKPFKRSRDVVISAPKILDPGKERDEFVIIPMVFDPSQVVGELKFWLTVTANKPVQLEPRGGDNLIQPKGGVQDEQESDEESDYEFEAADLEEKIFQENPSGGSQQKGPGKERRSAKQIIACCQKLQCKYEDPDFPVGSKMLNRSSDSERWKVEEVSFLRPCWHGQPDLREHLNCGLPPTSPPILFPEGGKSSVIKQGSIANSWFLAAASAVSVATKLEQLQSLFVEWNTECGVFVIRVFKKGKWKKVIIDDRLPAKKDSRALLFSAGVDAQGSFGQEDMRSQRIMWLPLLEKAYAKAFGCYERLSQGRIQHALKDLTAGAPQVLLLDESRAPDVFTRVVNGSLWRQMVDWLKSGCMLGFYFGGGASTAACVSLHKGRVYPILALKELEGGRMVQLWNPWQGDSQYSGDWGNSSSNWSKYRALAAECPHDDPNKFWMKADGEDGTLEKGEMYLTFQSGCLLVNRLFPSSWTITRSKAYWTRGGAKGPPFQPDDTRGEWLLNPQFELHVSEPRTLCFISLAQPQPLQDADAANPIGFVLLKRKTIEDKGIDLSRSDMLNPPPIQFKLDRECSLNFAVTLEPIDSPYLLVAFSSPGHLGKLFLSVWHNKPILLRGGVNYWDAASDPRDTDMDEPLVPEAVELLQDDPSWDKQQPRAMRPPATAHEEKRKEADELEVRYNEAAKQKEVKDPVPSEGEEIIAKSREATGEATGQRRQEAGQEGDRRDLCEQIVRKLQAAEVWQLKAILKLLD